MFPLLYFSCNYLSRTNAFSGGHFFGFAKQSKNHNGTLQGKKKDAKSLFLYTVDLQNKIVALLSFSLSPQVTIINVTSSFIHLFDYLVADCQNHAHDTAHSAAKCLAGSILPASKVKTIVRKWVS